MHISPEEKVQFSNLGKGRCSLHNTENLTTGTVPQSICGLRKMSFSGKKNPFHEEYLPTLASRDVISEKILKS